MTTGGLLSCGVDKRLSLVCLLACVACGRIYFDAAGDGGRTGDGTGVLSDGPAAASCATLALICGSEASSCCDSPLVTGGPFYRSYDVATDNMFTNTSYPATVSTFRLDKYEITVGRFRQFVAAGLGTQANPPPAGAGARPLNGMASQGGWDPAWTASLAADTASLVMAIKCDATYQTWTDIPGGNENRPMNCITWYDAMAFCAWDGGFLPTEAEWNYAAAGGSLARAYPWSAPASDLTLDDSSYASYWVDTTKQCYGDAMTGCTLTDLMPVGTKPAGDGRWGQSDLGGNVLEWVLDTAAFPYRTTTCDDCADLTTAPARVVRGSSFLEPASRLRSANRNSDGPTVRYPFNGARCARPP